MSVASTRLAEERKSWRKDHPMGFVAKPATNADGSVNLFQWNCLIPGKEGTLWEGGLYPLELQFSQSFPAEAPACRFPRGFTHPNVFDSGHVCLSIIGKGWKPSVNVKSILLGIQELLDSPNQTDPANWDANDLFIRHRKDYDRIVRAQAAKYSKENSGH